MQVKIFWGCVADAQRDFNGWAKGKALTRDVIIHSHAVERNTPDETSVQLMIIVICPEGKPWDTIKESPIETMAKI